MKQFLTTCFLISMMLISTPAQMVSDINFNQRNQQIDITYNLTGTKFYQKFFVSVFASKDGGLTYQGPLTQVSGDVGTGIVGGKIKKITWDVFKEMSDFEGDVIFKVQASIIENKLEKHFFIGYKGTQTAPIGFIAGITGRTGFYVSGRLNSNFFEKASYETDGESIIDYEETGYYTFLSNDMTQRLSVTAGIQFQVAWKIHVYAGAGFAQYNLLWQVEQYEYPETPKGKIWVKHTGESFNSFEAEAGIMYQLKHIFLTMGAASPGFQWVDFTFGAGIVF